MQPLINFGALTARIEALDTKSHEVNDEKVSYVKVRMGAIMHRSRFENLAFLRDINVWDETGMAKSAGIVLKLPKGAGLAGWTCVLRDEGAEGQDPAMRIESDITLLTLEPRDTWQWRLVWRLEWQATPGQLVWVYDRIDQDIIVTMSPAQLALELIERPDNNFGRITKTHAA